MNRDWDVSIFKQKVTPEQELALANAFRMARDLRNYKLDGNLIRRACTEGDPEAIDKLCDILISNLEERLELEKEPNSAPVLTHNQLPNSLAGRLAAMMADVCYMQGIPPPQRLNDLLRALLVPNARMQNVPRDAVAFMLAIAYWYENPDATQIEVANALNIARSTISRWRSTSNYKDWFQASNINTATKTSNRVVSTTNPKASANFGAFLEGFKLG